MEARMALELPSRQEQKVLSQKNYKFQPLAPRVGRAQRPDMKALRVEKKKWESDVTDRLEGLLEDMGWSERALAEEIHEPLGVTKKAVEQWFAPDRRSVPGFALYFLGQYLGVDVRYLMMVEGASNPIVNPRGIYATNKMLADALRENEALRGKGLKQKA